MKPKYPLSTIDYLNMVRIELKKMGKSTSDYSIAKQLNLNPASISRYMNNRGSMDDKTAVIVARFIGLPAIEVIAAMNAERAKDRKDKQFWIKEFKRFQEVAACLLIAICLQQSPTLLNNALMDSIYYVK